MVMPAAAKKVQSAAESMGFTVLSIPFTYVKDEVLWAKSENGHTAGEVRTPRKESEGLRLVGYRKEARLGFEVAFVPGFDSAKVYDPVGRFRDLAADYSISEDWAKTIGYSPEKAASVARRRDEEYNDGAQMMQYEWFVKNATEFYAWIDEWLKTLRSEHPPISAKPRATKEQKAAVREKVILDGGEWSA